jgi:hypothetical protein
MLVSPIGHIAEHIARLSPALFPYLFQVLISGCLIYGVMVCFALVYRSGAGDMQFSEPVTLVLPTNHEEGELTFGPRHFREKSVHIGKSPIVQFFAQVPDRPSLSYKAGEVALKIRVQDRNSGTVHDGAYAAKKCDGGQIGIDHKTRDKLEKYFSELYQREGRKLDADTARFIIRLKYPNSLNVAYLLREHPDASVRVGAWVFILTSVFSAIQSVLPRISDVVLTTFAR